MSSKEAVAPTTICNESGKAMATIGLVEGINDERSEPCPKFSPTLHEVEILAAHWLHEHQWASTGEVTGSTEWRTQVYAAQRLEQFKLAVGADEMKPIVARVAETDDLKRELLALTPDRS